MLSSSNRRPARTKPINHEDFADDKIGGYLNPNLAVILDLPEQPADYVVYALLGSFESNRVRISVQSSDS
jgi:hypothetical protein